MYNWGNRFLGEVTMTRIAVTFALILAVAPAVASAPGQPLDCSDWIADQPGYTCTPVRPAPCTSQWCANGADYVHVLNDGALYEFRLRDLTTGVYCGAAGPFTLRRLEFVKFDGVNETVLFHFSERCGASGTVDRIRYRTSQTFDEENGFLYVPLHVSCERGTGGSCAYPSDEYPEDGWNWLARIAGFTTEFDILQTYVPSASLGFRVPYMPEGLGGADHFDTYYGPLTRPLDFTQAQPLQCDYPAAPPQVGDYLTVADTLPNPPAGTGRYYVTSATYQGQTRYGRKRQGTVMSGRDPAVLPACVQP